MIITTTQTLLQPQEKQCQVCKQTKPLSKFQRYPYKDKIRIHYCCKLCDCSIKRQRYASIPLVKEKRIASNKRWGQNNQSRVKQNSKKWHQLPLNRILTSITKGNHSSSLIGCSRQELKMHLEKLFHSDMTWDNYGQVWEIRRIQSTHSLKHLPFDEREKILCHYTNLIPTLKPKFIPDEFAHLV